MITVKYLSEKDAYKEVCSCLYKVLPGQIKELPENFEDFFKEYGEIVDATAVYLEDGTFLDVKLFDPHHFVTDVYTNSNGHTYWLVGFCEDRKIMCEGGLSKEDIKEILSL